MQKNNKYAAFYEGGLYNEFAELEGKESPREPSPEVFARRNLAILPSLENTKQGGFWVESDKVATKMTTMMITVMLFSFCYFRYCFDLNGTDSPPRYGLHVSFTHLPLPSHMLEHCIPQGRLTLPNLFIASDK